MGIFQAIKMVQQVARTGMLEQDAFETSINSIFTADAESAEKVYGNIDDLGFGCRVLLAQLGDHRNNNKKGRDTEVTKYAISILVLERKLAKRPDLLKKIADGIEQAKSQRQHPHDTHDNVIANLANIYSENVSTLKPHIIVHGEQNHLSNTNNANKIRALLLAAIRSAVLWRQCGGTRWQILFKRKILIQETQKILDNAKERTFH